MFQRELILFIRNAVLLGGALLVAYSGADSLSLDALMAELDYVA
jgi:hypothetical protein